MKKNITNLEELEIEQKKLKMTMELTKQAFTKNLDTNRHQLKDFFVKKVVIPGGAIGLGYTAIKKVASIASDKKEQKEIPSSSSAGLLEKAFPLVLSIAQAYFFKQLGKEQKETPSAPTPEKNSIKHTLKKVV